MKLYLRTNEQKRNKIWQELLYKSRAILRHTLYTFALHLFVVESGRMAWTRAGSRPSYPSLRLASLRLHGFCVARCFARSSASSCFPRPSSSPWRTAASSPSPCLGTEPTRSLHLSSTVFLSQLSLCILLRLDSRPPIPRFRLALSTLSILVDKKPPSLIEFRILEIEYSRRIRPELESP